MKKLVLVLVVLLAVSGAVFAQNVSDILSAIPAASYAHPSDGTVWVFAATGITIQEKGRAVATISTSEMKDLRAIAAGGAGFAFNFKTDLYDRSYQFVYDATNGALRRTIDRSGLAQDVVTLQRQR